MEEIKISCPPELPKVEIMSVKDSDRLCRVFHETYTVCGITQGVAEWRYRGNRFSSGSKNLMMMEPGELHVTERILQRGTYFVLQLQPSFIDELAREAGARKTVHLKFAALNEDRAFQLFNKFHRSLEEAGDSLRDESFLVRAIQFLVSKCAEFTLSERNVFSPKVLVSARSFLLENWQNKITLGQLAAMSGLSRFHFLRAFSHHFGMPPHAYQRHVRITKALELLKRGLPPAKLDLGFSDQSHFTRHFKNTMGLTPGQYAAMVRKPLSGAAAA